MKGYDVQKVPGPGLQIIRLINGWAPESCGDKNHQLLLQILAMILNAALNWDLGMSEMEPKRTLAEWV